MVTIANILAQSPYSTLLANSDRAWFGNTVILTTTTTQRVTGVVTPANQLSSEQKYDIDGIIGATSIERLEN